MQAGSESCTKKTSYANLSWFGDRGKPFTAIDTPGHDDPDGADIDSPEARERRWGRGGVPRERFLAVASVRCRATPLPALIPPLG